MWRIRFSVFFFRLVPMLLTTRFDLILTLDALKDSVSSFRKLETFVPHSISSSLSF